MLGHRTNKKGGRIVTRAVKSLLTVADASLLTASSRQTLAVRVCRALPINKSFTHAPAYTCSAPTTFTGPTPFIPTTARTLSPVGCATWPNARLPPTLYPACLHVRPHRHARARPSTATAYARWSARFAAVRSPPQLRVSTPSVHRRARRTDTTAPCATCGNTTRIDASFTATVVGCAAWATPMPTNTAMRVGCAYLNTTAPTGTQASGHPLCRTGAWAEKRPTIRAQFATRE